MATAMQYLKGRGDLVSKLIMGKIEVIGVIINLLT